MRQVWFLAAAGIYALDNHLDRLVEDHQKAQEIGKVLSTLNFIKKVEPIETNIIIFEVNETILSVDNFLKKLEEKNISIISMGQGKLRIVTHLDYIDSMHGTFLKALSQLA